MHEHKPIHPSTFGIMAGSHLGPQKMAECVSSRQPYILAEIEDIGRTTSRLEEAASMLGERLVKAMRIVPSNPMNQCKRESTSVEMADHLAGINERLQSVINSLKDYLDRLEI